MYHHTQQVSRGLELRNPSPAIFLNPVINCRAVTKAMATAADVEEVVTDHDKARAYMMQAVLGFNQQLERIGRWCSARSPCGWA
jgi:hypothetical protein